MLISSYVMCVVVWYNVTNIIAYFQNGKRFSQKLLRCCVVWHRKAQDKFKSEKPKPLSQNELRLIIRKSHFCLNNLPSRIISAARLPICSKSAEMVVRPSRTISLIGDSL